MCLVFVCTVAEAYIENACTMQETMVSVSLTPVSAINLKFLRLQISHKNYSSAEYAAAFISESAAGQSAIRMMEFVSQARVLERELGDSGASAAQLLYELKKFQGELLSSWADLVKVSWSADLVKVSL